MSIPEENGSEVPWKVAWDPYSPSVLVHQEGRGRDLRFVAHFSDNGVGCNSFESAALLKILDARDEYLENVSAIGSYGAVQNLCKSYCKAIEECNIEWGEYLRGMNQEKEEDNMEVENIAVKASASHEGLELLTIVHALIQLSGIFLLQPSGIPGTKFKIDSGEVFGSSQAASQLDGAGTADTIRFLRHHMLGVAEAQFLDDEIDELYELYQPDEWKGGKQYWELMGDFFIRGYLEDAWALFSRHSMVRRVYEHDLDGGVDSDDYRTSSLSEDREGFEALKAILLSAPIPGGRNDKTDSGFAKMNDPDDATLATGVAVVEEEYLEGIPTSAYRLWDRYDVSRRPGDYTIHFEPRAAYGIFENWQKSIKSIPALQRLRARIPELNKLLDVLCGDNSGIQIGSWQEDLCTNLLYSIPNIKLADIPKRTIAAMQKFDALESDTLAEGIVQVMGGNADQVLSLVFNCGGGSAAALPAVLTSLLNQLFVDAGILEDSEDDNSLTVEYAIHAASAIRSSLVIEGHQDLGTRLTAQLLLPFIRVGSDLRYTATLTDTLEHYVPKSDSDANRLLSMCRKLVERRNVRVLDGCDSICLARYLYYKSEQKPGGAIYWLVIGIELESLVFCNGSSRTGDWQSSLSSGLCFRKLIAEFTGTSQSLLKSLVGDDDQQESASTLYARAQEMMAAQKESSFTPFIPIVKVLDHVIAMAQAISERQDNMVVANSIVACLEERRNDEGDGEVVSLASPCMHWDLLRLATIILERDAYKGNLAHAASFDVKGMRVLMSTFTICVEFMKATNKVDKIAKHLDEMRLNLGDGLKRAFVAQNKNLSRRPIPRKLPTEGVYGAEFDRYPREVQELAVAIMLGDTDVK